MFDRPVIKERALLVHVINDDLYLNEEIAEFNELVISAGAQPLSLVTTTRKIPNPKYFIGEGKVDEIGEEIEANDVEIVIFNQSLSPSQERNLEKRWQRRVLDRTDLILDIFAQRAQTYEGKLQVELAQLKHISTRLVRGWTHLERQKGGIGLRGPGEKQLETDRRLINVRIKRLLERLEKVDNQREQGRKSRKKSEIPTISLVGYTNTGKSTLFNNLAQADVMAKDQLFATLDPTLRRLDVPGVGPVILADTVGFIRYLPHDLVAAFRSTLQETVQADLLLHVVDANDSRRQDSAMQVNDVLKEIGADHIPQIEIYNKIDLLDEISPHVDLQISHCWSRVWLSAKNNQGINYLLQAVANYLSIHYVKKTVKLPPQAGQLRAKLYQMHCVLGEVVTQEGQWLMDLQIESKKKSWLENELVVMAEPNNG